MATARFGLVERYAGDHAKAMEHFVATLETDRDYPEANVALAEWIERRGELDEACEKLRHALHGTDDNFEIPMALDTLAHQSDDLAAASEAFGLAHAQQSVETTICYHNNFTQGMG